MLAPGGFLLIYADTTPGASELHSGFTLKQSGGALYLFDKAANGGGLLDSVEFGLQLPDLSVGRIADGTWALTVPTFGAQNVAHPLGDARHLRINEWLADASSSFDSGFIELYNPDPAPVNRASLYLTDNPIGAPTNYVIAPLSFIAASGFAVFRPINNRKGDHLTLRCRTRQRSVCLANGTKRCCSLSISDSGCFRRPKSLGCEYVRCVRPTDAGCRQPGNYLEYHCDVDGV
jgi:hypothetical protein